MGESPIYWGEKYNGTTLEQPPNQPNGGGFNSTFSVGSVTGTTPLAPEASIYVQFLLGRQQTGCECVELDVPVNHDTRNPGAQISAYEFTCDSFSAVGTGTPGSGFVEMRVWRGVVFGAVVIDSYADVGAPTAYAAITANGSYRITAAYPRQSGKLIGRIYRTPVAAFGAWDISTFQDVTVVCTYREFIPLRVR